jgi:hypothetical protein
MRRAASRSASIGPCACCRRFHRPLEAAHADYSQARSFPDCTPSRACPSKRTSRSVRPRAWPRALRAAARARASRPYSLLAEEMKPVRRSGARHRFESRSSHLRATFLPIKEQPQRTSTRHSSINMVLMVLLRPTAFPRNAALQRLAHSHFLHAQCKAAPMVAFRAFSSEYEPRNTCLFDQWH